MMAFSCVYTADGGMISVKVEGKKIFIRSQGQVSRIYLKRSPSEFTQVSIFIAIQLGAGKSFSHKEMSESCVSLARDHGLM